MPRLEMLARAWARNLFEFRDGRPGLLQEADWEPVTIGKGKNRARGLRSRRVIQSFLIPIGGPNQLPRELVDKGWIVGERRFPEKAKRGGVWWSLIPSKAGDSEMVDRLRQAWAVGEMRKAIRALRPCSPGGDASIEVLLRHTSELVHAKRLPSYPKALVKKRPKSEEKRIAFFAKVFAGLEMGISPATAIKRLHGLDLPKEEKKQESERWSVYNPNPLTELVLTEQGQIVKRTQQEEAGQ